jgi:hypothetical protein
VMINTSISVHFRLGLVSVRSPVSMTECGYWKTINKKEKTHELLLLLSQLFGMTAVILS